MTTGGRAKDSTIEQLLRDQPQLNALYERNLADDDLLDMRPVLARAKALAEWAVSRIEADDRNGTAGQMMAFKAIQALANVMRAGNDMLRIEERLGPVTHAELRRLTNAIVNTIKQHVPAERQPEALAFLRQQIAPGH